MDYISIIFIAIGLAMDAFAVSIVNGACNKINLKNSLEMAFSFGFFQFFMPIIGWLIGKASEFIIDKVDHWIAFILLGYIGFKMFYESKESSNSTNYTNNVSYKTIITLAFATSIYALATGIILPNAIHANTSLLMVIATSIIGIITFFISFIGIYIGKKFGNMFSSKAQKLGGIILISIGTKILIQGLL